MIRRLGRRDRLTLRALLGWSLVALIALLFLGFRLSNVLMAFTFVLGFSNITAWWICRREARQPPTDRRGPAPPS